MSEIDITFSICVMIGLLGAGLGALILWIEHKEKDGKGEE
jgi:hypothetical protein